MPFSPTHLSGAVLSSALGLRQLALGLARGISHGSGHCGVGWTWNDTLVVGGNTSGHHIGLGIVASGAS